MAVTQNYLQGRNIHSQVASQFYRIFTRKYIHPSERYIAVPGWDTFTSAFLVSKNYGQTWQVAPMSPGPNEPNGDNVPSYEDVMSFTVVNDQGFLQTKHSLYTSSKPFEDPRILPGGPGIPYTLEDGTVQTVEPSAPGWAWGMVYMTKLGLSHSTSQFKTNWQDLPDHLPEVKNYQGWDHMRCDMDAGKVAKKL
ncbi:T6SS immunity protein Tli3 family protein [Rahnella ecdela]